MERQQKTWTIYQIVAPDGRAYVGCTCQPLNERFRQHRRLALEKDYNHEHPLYNALRETSGEGFRIQPLLRATDYDTAQLLEIMYIAAVPENLRMNLSRGGFHDSEDGARIFWSRLNEQPERRKAYIKKLSDTKRGNNWTDYDALARAAADWRKRNPKEAYKLAYRGIRCARRIKGEPPSGTQNKDALPLKERLRHKYRLNDIKREYVTEIWARRSAEDRAAIGQKISHSKRTQTEALSEEQRREMTDKARSAIDRSVQGPAASKGLKNWWAELRKDPERYNAYMAQRKATRSAKKEVEKCAPTT